MSLFQARSNKALQGKHSVTRAFGTAFASERSAHARKGARHRGASVAPRRSAPSCWPGIPSDSGEPTRARRDEQTRFAWVRHTPEHGR